MSDEPIKNCPDCSGPVNKIISSSSFHLAGGGWFADGYSNDQKKTSQSTEVADKKVETPKVGSDTNKSKDKVPPSNGDK